jgi:coatomer subunit beta'
MYKNFTERAGGLDVGFQAEGLSGGTLLGVMGQGGVSFFDWQTGGLVRRIEVEPKHVRLPAAPMPFSLKMAAANVEQIYWSDSGELVSIACEDTFYVLRFSRESYVEAVQSGEVEEDGVEAAFEVVTDINER